MENARRRGVGLGDAGVGEMATSGRWLHRRQATQALADDLGRVLGNGVSPWVEEVTDSRPTHALGLQQRDRRQLHRYEKARRSAHVRMAVLTMDDQKGLSPRGWAFTRGPRGSLRGGPKCGTIGMMKDPECRLATARSTKSCLDTGTMPPPGTPT